MNEMKSYKKDGYETVLGNVRNTLEGITKKLISELK